MPQRKIVEFDGRTGEGGGQLVRIAVGLSALTGVPIRIHNVRGNRGGGQKGGGLKAQHASCVKWLAEATQAEVTGCFIGSKEFTFKPMLLPSQLQNRNIKIDADSAASTMLVFQAIFPFLLFAGNEQNAPISVTIRGGTNVSFSLSYEYLDQVLLPSLEKFGVPIIERKIDFCRGWSIGTRQIGAVSFKFLPLPAGQSLQSSRLSNLAQGPLSKIDVSLIVPQELRGPLRASLMFELDLVFPGVAVNAVVDEDSGHRARLYTLLVAHTSNGFRIGHDWLYDKTTKNKSNDKLATEVAQKVADGLYDQVRNGGGVDEHLQDQLIVFQALASGTSIVGLPEDDASSGEDGQDGPFGKGSMHSQTARWVTSTLLPKVKWSKNGLVCEGIGWRCEP